MPGIPGDIGCDDGSVLGNPRIEDPVDLFGHGQQGGDAARRDVEFDRTGRSGGSDRDGPDDGFATDGPDQQLKTLAVAAGDRSQAIRKTLDHVGDPP